MVGQNLNWAWTDQDFSGEDGIVGIQGTIFKHTESEKIIEIGASWPEKYISTKFSWAFEVVGQKLNWAWTDQDFSGEDAIVGIQGTIFKDTESEKIIEIGASWPEK